MRSLNFTIAKNAFSNVMRGTASAVVAILLPHFLTHYLGRDRFAGWALMLQLAAYANYFDFGLQTAVTRYLAGALDRKDSQELDRLMSSATAILTAVGLAVGCVMAVLSWQLPHLFRTAPMAIVGEIQAGTLVLGLLAAAALPMSAFAGALAGMQRNEFVA